MSNEAYLGQQLAALIRSAAPTSYRNGNVLVIKIGNNKYIIPIANEQQGGTVMARSGRR